MMIQNAKLNHYMTRIGQELAMNTGWRISKPCEAILLLTYRCNARCVHCYSYNMPRMQEMSTDEWLKTLDELYDWLGPIFISFTGGEALLRKDAIDIAAHAAKLGFWVEFLSNGWVLDEEKSERLVNSGIKRLKISIDGTIKKVHDEIRGIKNFYERSYNALKSAAEQMRANNRDIQLYAKTAIMSINIKNLSEIVHLAKQLGIYGVEFQALEPIYYSEQQNDPNWYQDNPLWIEDTSVITRAMGELKQLKADGYPIINTMENLEMIERYFLDPDTEKQRVQSHNYKKRKLACQEWAKGLQIDPEGNLRMCHSMEPFGNAKEGNLPHTWKHRSSCGRCGRP